jgi:type I restriction enzyme S subunit
LPKFIFSVFQQVDWLKHNEAGGVPSLSKTNIEKIKFAIPAPAEQQKIANCLTSVDELIAAQAQKVDALKTHKKGLMQQLFPREGETQPRLRFPEFKTLWKAGVLDQIASTVMGNAFRSTDFIESGTQVIRIGNLYQGELQLDRSPIYMSDSQASENSKFTVNAFDILMSMTGTMGKRDYGFVVQVPADCKQLLLNQRVMKIVPKRNCDAGFLLQLLKNESLLEQLYSIPGGTKQANLSAQDVKELNICYPQIPEQQRISSCLRTLDTLITTEAQKLETLKLHKRGLMQQLFPSPEVIPA